jgi:hypothetical protein
MTAPNTIGSFLRTSACDVPHPITRCVGSGNETTWQIRVGTIREDVNTTVKGKENLISQVWAHPSKESDKKSATKSQFTDLEFATKIKKNDFKILLQNNSINHDAFWIGIVDEGYKENVEEYLRIFKPPNGFTKSSDQPDQVKIKKTAGQGENKKVKMQKAIAVTYYDPREGVIRCSKPIPPDPRLESESDAEPSTPNPKRHRRKNTRSGKSPNKKAKRGHRSAHAHKAGNERAVAALDNLLTDMKKIKDTKSLINWLSGVVVTRHIGDISVLETFLGEVVAHQEGFEDSQPFPNASVLQKVKLHQCGANMTGMEETEAWVLWRKDLGTPIKPELKKRSLSPMGPLRREVAKWKDFSKLA